jgi:hypothetical protein
MRNPLEGWQVDRASIRSGADLRTVYVGSLRGTTIPHFRSPVPGLPLVRWSEHA